MMMPQSVAMLAPAGSRRQWRRSRALRAGRAAAARRL